MVGRRPGRVRDAGQARPPRGRDRHARGPHRLGHAVGGISLFFGYYVFIEWGVAESGGWKVAWPIPLGVLYGIYAIGMGLVMLGPSRLDLERALAQPAAMRSSLTPAPPGLRLSATRGHLELGRRSRRAA